MARFQRGTCPNCFRYHRSWPWVEYLGSSMTLRDRLGEITLAFILDMSYISAKKGLWGLKKFKNKVLEFITLEKLPAV